MKFAVLFIREVFTMIITVTDPKRIDADACITMEFAFITCYIVITKELLQIRYHNRYMRTQLSLRDRATRACQLKSCKVLHK